MSLKLEEAPTQAAVVARLAATLDTVLRRHIPVDRPVALLDFPSHTNVGDSAIWLGEVAWLRKAGLDVSYVCTNRDYSPARLRERVDGGTILLHGGGNLGDIWPRHQDFRERVLKDFRSHKIVQLPQSVHFERGSAVDRAAMSFRSHPDFTLLVRDAASLEFATDRLDGRAELCPDSAFALGSLTRPCVAEVDVLYLRRQDREARQTPGHGRPSIPQVDWQQDWPWSERRSRSAASVALRRAKDHRRAFALLSGGAWWCYHRLARRQLDRGTRLLSTAHVLVTDRLHGHILALLLGIPHVLLDNSYGKVGGFHDAWTFDAPIVHRAATEAEALERAEAMLSARAGADAT